MAKVKNCILWIYLFIMLGFFPLYYKQRYVGMGDGKYKVFLYTSVVCLGILIVLSVINYLVYTLKNTDKAFSGKKRNLSYLDKAVIIYFLVITVSFLFSDFKQESLIGADGWCMGLAAQLIFFFSYFFISRDFKWNKHIITILLISSSIVFLLGIFHRFYIDPLSMYVGLNETYRLQFLSTIGQSSWYSSFVCTVFPVGLYIFFSTTKSKIKIWTGMYCVLGFSTIVTQNTDSAYLSTMAVFFLLLYLSMDSAQNKKRFWECVLLMLGSFKLMGILQIIFKEHCIQLDSLSIQMSQGLITTILFILAIVYYVVRYYIKPSKKEGLIKKYPFYILVLILGAGVLGTLIFIVLNSNGYLLEKWGYCNTNNYLLFNDNWGNNRGFTWRFSVFSFKNFTVVQKLFGVGPDCFKAYNYSIPEYADVLHGFWGKLNLTNAHNEYLTTLINYGIFGLISYFGMLITGIATFIKARKNNLIVAGFALCIIAYMAHNIFCYQQVCCTPFIYIFMGLGANIIRNQITEEY